MSVHVATGNALDVVYTYKDGRRVLQGLQRHGSDEIIPLPEPDGLIETLRVVMNEIRTKEQSLESTKRTPSL